MSDREKLIEDAAIYAECCISRDGVLMEMTRDEMAHIWRSAMSSGRGRVILAKYAAFIAAIEAAGVRLVPRAATMEMQHAVAVYHLPRNDGYGNYADSDIQLAARVIYADMIAASPYAPEANAGEGDGR